MINQIAAALKLIGGSFQVGGEVADYQWGKDIKKAKFTGNRYLGGNPVMAGRYQGEYANMDSGYSTYLEHKEPGFTKAARWIGPALTTVGEGLSSFGGGGSKREKGKYKDVSRKITRSTDKSGNTFDELDKAYKDEPNVDDIPFNTRRVARQAMKDTTQVPNESQGVFNSEYYMEPETFGTGPKQSAIPSIPLSPYWIPEQFGTFGYGGAEEVERVPGYSQNFLSPMERYDRGEGGYYAKSGIYIKPSRRGTFTKWCKEHGYGGVTSDCISAAKGKGGAVAKKAVFAQNARKWKKGEDGLLIEDVEGRTHEEGGEKRILNGQPVEIEDEEQVWKLPNGAIAVLNESQQALLESGVPLSKIAQKLPKVANKAEDGTEIPPNLPYGLKDLPFIMEMAKRYDEYGYSLPEFEYVDNAVKRPEGVKKGVQVVTPDDITDPELYNTDRGSDMPVSTWNEGYETSGDITGSGGGGTNRYINKDIQKILDKYKSNQKWNAIGNAGQGFAEAASNIVAYLKNLKEQPPDEVEKAKAVWPVFVPANPEPMARVITQQANAAKSTANQMGTPELLSVITAQSSDALNKLYADTEAINAQGRNSLSQAVINAGLQTNEMNMRADMEDIKNLFQWETTMGLAQQSNMTEAFGALREINKSGQLATNNMLNADIVNYLIETGQIDQLYSLFR